MSHKEYTSKECEIKLVDRTIYVGKNVEIKDILTFRDSIMSGIDSQYRDACDEIMNSFDAIIKDLSVQKEKDEALKSLRKLSRSDALDAISTYFKEDEPTKEDSNREDH